MYKFECKDYFSRYFDVIYNSVTIKRQNTIQDNTIILYSQFYKDLKPNSCIETETKGVFPFLNGFIRLFEIVHKFFYTIEFSFHLFL